MSIINITLMRRPEIFISQLLIKKDKTVAVAESCTGGLLANLFTNIPGSSQYFLLGIVAYSNQTKISLLKIPAMLIKQHGAVSSQIAQLMAQNIRRIASSDYGIGITGIAGPGGARPGKPAGTVFISIVNRNKAITKRFHFTGNRLVVKRKATLKALSILKKFLLKK
jgi:PncC family amidohydrolase